MRFSKESRQISPPEFVAPIPTWQRRIEQSHGFLATDIQSLERVASGTQEEMELSWRIATRVGNFTRAVIDSGDSIALEDNPHVAYMQIAENEDESRVYYSPARNEVSSVAVLKRDIFRRRVYNFGGRNIVPLDEWGRNAGIRDRVIGKIRGLLPIEVQERLEDLNKGVKGI